MIVEHVPLADGVDAWFTGRDRAGDERGDGGNLAHRRPHQPAALARRRADVGRRTATSPARWHLMQQVHGAEVAVVDDQTPIGAELRGVDGIVTTVADRPLVVQVADCVPVLLAGVHTVAAIHAGRSGVLSGVVPAAVERVRALDDEGPLVGVLGPAIGGCCYEVPVTMRDEVARRTAAASATTTWGTPSLDLPAAVTAQLQQLGVEVMPRVGGCTRCDPQQRWFSHRADPSSGRQIGLVVRRPPAHETLEAPA